MSRAGHPVSLQLTAVRRFITPWEGPASLQLHCGDPHIAPPPGWPGGHPRDPTLAGDIAVHRDTCGITDMTTTLGTQPADTARHQHQQ